MTTFVGATAPARLTPETLATAHPEAVPSYPRDGVPSIVHLGVGAFARAHLGTYADDLLAAGRPASVHGVSLLSDRAEAQLAPQGGLYTVSEREPGAPGAPRVIGALTRISTGEAAALDAIAAAPTSLVTLTVTEKGYLAGSPTGVAPLIARGLGRRDRSLPPPVIAPLDNVLGNGGVLRRCVLAAAEQFDRELARWIDGTVPFVDSVVDRMVPATTPADLTEVAHRLGLCDHAAVICERHRSWAMAGYAGPLPLGDVGVELVGDLAPYERRKLWLLNGPHSALAYLGLLTGCDTIAEATARTDVLGFVQGVVTDVLDVIDLPRPLDATRFAAATLRRFANPALGHRCLQVAADGSTKLPQRIVPAAAARYAAGLPSRRLALVAAVWLAAVSGIEIGGAGIPSPDDPLAPELDRLPPRERPARAMQALTSGTDERFADDVRAELDQLLRLGPATLGAHR